MANYTQQEVNDILFKLLGGLIADAETSRKHARVNSDIIFKFLEDRYPEVLDEYLDFFNKEINTKEKLSSAYDVLGQLSSDDQIRSFLENLGIAPPSQQ